VSKVALAISLGFHHTAVVGCSEPDRLDETFIPLPVSLQDFVSCRLLRLTVKRVLGALAVYPNRAELFRDYPELEDHDIRQVLAYEAALDDRIIELPKSA
jgi:hypothetical protein